MSRRRDRYPRLVALLLALVLLARLLRAVAGQEPTPQPARAAAVASVRDDANTVDVSRIETPHAPRLLPVRSGHRLIITHLYALSLNPETKLADWCAYVVTPGGFDTGNALDRNWKTVHQADALESADYAGSDYQRGHLCPLASFKASPYAHETNRTEALAPMRGSLNGGPWAALEERARQRAREAGAVEVCCGPIFSHEMPPLPQADEPHRVPSHFWLVLRTPRALESYVLPQTAAGDPLAYKVPLAELCRQARLNPSAFFDPQP